MAGHQICFFLDRILSSPCIQEYPGGSISLPIDQSLDGLLSQFPDLQACLALGKAFKV